MAGEKRCLYEVLGLGRECTPDQIRSAYKRLALQYHPDKLAASGAASDASATAKFQEILNAYEVLSDPRERAWYDSHRSQILFSPHPRPSGAGGLFDPPDLFSFFSNTAFSGFSDTRKGFYKVYGDLFGKIYAREVDFAGKMGMGAGAVREAPAMGNLESAYAQVTAFYGYWMGFCTVMDFAWVDEYEAVAGMPRKMRRAMDEENKKARKKARREYNETVRGLAEFVKKRDKRVIEMGAKRRAEEEERRAKEKVRKEAEVRERAERARAYKEEEWMQAEEVVDDELEEEEERKNDVKEEFYCVVCSKKFKSEKQWINHEKSKKHKEKVAELRDTFEREDMAEKDEFADAMEGSHGDELDELCKEFEEKGVIDEEEIEDNRVEDLEENNDINEEVCLLEAMVSGSRSTKKNGFKLQTELSSSNVLVDDDGDELESMAYDSRKKSRRSRRAKKEGGVKVKEENAKREENGATDEGIRSTENESEGDLKPMKDVSSVSESNDAEEIQSDKTRKSKSGDRKGVGQRDTNGKVKNTSKGKKQKVLMEKILVCLHYDGVFINFDAYVGGKRKLMPVQSQVKYLELLQQVEERLPLKSATGTLSVSYCVDSEPPYLLEDDKDVESIFLLHKSNQGTNGLLHLYVEWTSTGNNMETSTLNNIDF